MHDLVPFSVFFLVLAAISFAIGRAFPPCMFQKPIRWSLYAVSVVLVGVVIYAWVMASILRPG